MDPNMRRRAGVLCAAFAAVFFGLVLRLWSLQIAGHEEAARARHRQASGWQAYEAPRGEIRDARGEILAVSVPVVSVWADPSAIDDPVAAAGLLAPALGLREDFVWGRLSDRERRFAWLKREVSPAEAAAVRALLERAPFKPARRSPLPKVGFATEFARRYPHGPLAAQVLGFLSKDEGKNEGIERAYDAHLNGGRRVVPIDRDGRRQVLGGAPLESAGAAVVLTLDLAFQRIVEEELDAACAEFRPRWAVAIAIDPRTGAILAVANRPSFDPNQPGRSSLDTRRNRAVTDPYEPGSTFKAFVVALALDQGLVRPETVFDCENGLWIYGPRRLKDHKPYGKLMLREAFKVSSNVAAAKLGALVLGRARLHGGLKAFGFGDRTGADLPAEDDGRLLPISRWNLFSDTSVPIGHEVAVTPLQLVSAMAAIANGGTLYRPYAVARIVAADGTVLAAAGPHALRRVVGEKAARETIEMLKAVVREGTGKKAQVPGIEVAGKTGTTQKIDPRTRQYTHEKYISSFVGFAPADEAKVCVAVILDEPQGAYYGGAVAAPVVGKIIQRGLVHLK